MADTDQYLRSPVDLEDCFDDSYAYSTPVTSPEPTPIKHLTRSCNAPVPQLDGKFGDARSVQDDYSEDEQTDTTPTIEKSMPKVAQIETGNFFQARTTSNITVKATARPRTHSLLSSSSLQHRRFVNSINYPDRFVPPREHAPTKERLALTSTAVKDCTSNALVDVDPFAPPSRHSTRLNQYFTVTRYPGPATRSHGLIPTGVRREEQLLRQLREMATTWSVGGVPVTEGIVSVTNGRGGRITSSTNAPLYNADMLDPRLTSNETAILGQRLAMAMDFEQSGKVIKSNHGYDRTRRAPIGLTDVVVAGQKTVWKESRWQTNRPPSAPAKRLRQVPALPYRVLDAPQLRNDYYCSLLAYSSTLRCLAVGLGRHIYLWSDKKAPRVSGVLDSMKFPEEFGHVTTLAFSSTPGGKGILAIGCADGHLTLWSPKERSGRLTYDQPSPVSHISFRPCTTRRPSKRDPNIMVETEDLLVGTESGKVLLFSVEWPDQHQCELFGWSRSMVLRTIIACNDQQICGIAWSAQGEMVAVGGNDNLLFVYDFGQLQRNTIASTRENLRRARMAREETPGAYPNHPVVLPGTQKQRFVLNAAVKAIAFAPWQPSLLAASGGSNDRCIHFLHTHSGATLATINCHAQVTSLVWNKSRKEIAATLGFAQPDHPFRVVVFAWPSCKQVARIPWPNEERALYGIPYPGVSSQGRQDECIVIATSDHSIKFHEVWPQEKQRCKQSASHAESQILNDMCSESLENEMQIR